jgi:hypothetical protein
MTPQDMAGLKVGDVFYDVGRPREAQPFRVQRWEVVRVQPRMVYARLDGTPKEWPAMPIGRQMFNLYFRTEAEAARAAVARALKRVEGLREQTRKAELEWEALTGLSLSLSGEAASVATEQLTGNRPDESAAEPGWCR